MESLELFIWEVVYWVGVAVQGLVGTIIIIIIKMNWVCWIGSASSGKHAHDKEAMKYVVEKVNQGEMLL